MEYGKVLSAILTELEKHNIPYAIVGAVAMGFWEAYEKIFGFR